MSNYFQNYFQDASYPLVSAVIPTRGRPHLLLGAVRSALGQTWSAIEVIVVVDGPDPHTILALDSIIDPRVRLLVLPEPCGGSEARNAGVRIARGDWIAFLDDDDEWLPEKIDRQMRAAHAMPDWFPVVSCRLIAQSPATRRVLPPRPYQPRQAIADFLFCRTSLRDPGGVMQTSTLLAPRDLLLAIPFRCGLPVHQDWDWLIRVASCKGVGLSMVRRPLTIWRVEDGRTTIGRNKSWQTSLAWIRSVRPLISPRAFSWFVAVQCAWRAQAGHQGLRAKLTLLHALVDEGTPEFRSLLTFLIFAFLPARFRQWFRTGFHPRPASADSSPGLHLVSSRKPSTPFLRRSSF
jgi:glycosyltransferase involved in cell wall biosynthesis